MMKPRILELRKAVLDKNDEIARTLRARFEAAGVFVVNLVSSPGAGKTALLEETMRRMLERNWRVAAIVGDLATENDARRLARSGAPVRQIETGGLCHLEAELVARRLEGWALEELDFLFIENVGNLVCPSDYDLGEALRVVLLSTTEGEDKPNKYPPMFHSAAAARSSLGTGVRTSTVGFPPGTIFTQSNSMAFPQNEKRARSPAPIALSGGEAAAGPPPAG
jgi:hydrogenase nickel incorporation protein HypB